MHPFLSLTLLPALLIPDLDARAFRTRQRAHDSLRALGPLATPALCHAEAHPKSDEQRRRCATLLAPYEGWILDARSRNYERKRYPCLPWMYYLEGCQPIDWREADRYFKLAGCEGDGEQKGDSRRADRYWPRYREATRLWLVDQLRARRPAAEIRAVLDALAAEEARYNERENRRPRPEE